MQREHWSFFSLQIEIIVSFIIILKTEKLGVLTLGIHLIRNIWYIFWLDSSGWRYSVDVLDLQKCDSTFGYRSMWSLTASQVVFFSCRCSFKMLFLFFLIIKYDSRSDFPESSSGGHLRYILCCQDLQRFTGLTRQDPTGDTIPYHTSPDCG